MATQGVRGAGRNPEGFRAAQHALQGLAGTPRRSGPARTGASSGSRESGAAPAPHGQILSITWAAARDGVRPHKVAEARQRIAEGYYDRPDVRGQLVNSLLRSFGELDEG